MTGAVPVPGSSTDRLDLLPTPAVQPEYAMTRKYLRDVRRPPVTGPPDAPAPASPGEIFRRFAEAVVPRLADYVAVHLFDDPARGAEASERGGRSLWRVISLDATESRRFGRLLPAGRGAGGRYEPAGGGTVHIPRVDGPAADRLAAQFDAPRLARALLGRALLALPLAAPDRVLGHALIVSEPERPAYRDREITLLEELAHWAAAEADGALPHREGGGSLEHRLWLESGPEVPARTAGLDLAFRYVPAQTPPSLLGGDWLDVIPLPRGRTALVVGDVAGHGVEAGLRMSRCKTMVRTLASLDLSPDDLLGRLDRLVCELGEQYDRDEEFLATCVYAVYDPAARECRVASAGHPPPVLINPDGRGEALAVSPGPPIGCGDGGFVTSSFATADGSLLVLYSDGLLENRHRDFDEGVRALTTRLLGPPKDLEQTCDELMARFAAAGHQDDVTLFLTRLTGVPSDIPAYTVRQAEEGPFIGRSEELDEVAELLGRSRLVSVTGAPGIGKTRLALRAAHLLRDDFPDGTCLVRLSGVHDPRLLARAVAEALGVDAERGRSWDDTVIARLSGRRMLLIVDGCEHLVTPCADLLRRVLEAAPGVRVLATGRHPLRVPGEHLLALAPLEPDEALDLLLSRSPQSDLDRARALCSRLDRVPLAIVLAAERLRDLSVDDLLERLRRPFDALAGDLRAAIDRSHELCTSTERLLWARLSVFAGGFDLAEAEEICSDDELPRDEILNALAGLVHNSIVIPDGDSRAQRFRMLGLLAEYGRERLDRLGEGTSLRRRHRDAYRRIVRAGTDGWLGPGQVEHCALLRREHPNLREALEFSFTHPGEAEAGLDIATALWPLWIVGGSVTEGRTWLGRGLSLAPASSPRRAAALWLHAWLAAVQGDRVAALTSVEECCVLSSRTGDTRQITTSIQISAEAALRRGDSAVAFPLYREALARFHADADYLGVCTSLFQFALCHALHDTPDYLHRAVDLCDEGIWTCEAFDELWCRSWCEYTLALSFWRLDQPHSAQEAALRSLALKRRLQDRPGIALCLELLAWIAATEGRHEQAARWLGAAHPITQETGTHLAGYPQLATFHDQAKTTIQTALGPDRTRHLIRSRNRPPGPAPGSPTHLPKAPAR
ncbi:SpoIIE family protein phosphatase [Actinomadura sp. NBRC 104412]|uniref:SpoIIE family protein phosphatase n=1 Tax=Actinomadura sp. NBRC 104412 TaxID=3032203 RepID=UPI0025544F42|nr:SpoIIE family protein phosphatase [Actinomadura sp. NBRC 104412]